MQNKKPEVELSAWLTHTIVQLVDDESAVDVNSTLAADGAVALAVSVSALDLGKVIGKQGRTARSIRSMLGAMAMKYQVRFSLNISNEATQRVEAPCQLQEA